MLSSTDYCLIHYFAHFQLLGFSCHYLIAFSCRVRFYKTVDLIMDSSTSPSSIFLDAQGEPDSNGIFPTIENVDSFLNWDFETIEDTNWTPLHPSSSSSSDLTSPTITPGSTVGPVSPRRNISRSSIPASEAMGPPTLIPQSIPGDVVTPAIAAIGHMAAQPVGGTAESAQLATAVESGSSERNNSKVECPCCGEALQLSPSSSFHAHIRRCFVEKHAAPQKEGCPGQDWASMENLKHVQSSISKLNLSTRLGMMESFYRLSQNHALDIRRSQDNGESHILPHHACPTGSSENGHGEPDLPSISLTALPITAKNNAHDKGVLRLLFSRNPMTTEPHNHGASIDQDTKMLTPISSSQQPARAMVVDNRNALVGEDVLGRFVKNGIA